MNCNFTILSGFIMNTCNQILYNMKKYFSVLVETIEAELSKFNSAKFQILNGKFGKILLISFAMILPGISEAQCPSDLYIEYETIQEFDHCGTSQVAVRLVTDNANLPIKGMYLIISFPSDFIIDTYWTLFSINNNLDPSEITISSGSITINFLHSTAQDLGDYEALLTIYFIGEPSASGDFETGDFTIALSNLSPCYKTEESDSETFTFPSTEIVGEVTTPLSCSGTSNHGLYNTTIRCEPWAAGTVVPASCTTATNSSGEYSCNVLRTCGWLVYPSKANPVACGVNSTDYSLLYSHLYNAPLGCLVGGSSDFWKLYAADMDRNNTLNSTDLGVITSIINNTFTNGAWNGYYFLPGSQLSTLTGENDDCATALYDPNDFEYIVADASQKAADFFAVKPGDIDASCTSCNTFTGGNASIRTAESNHSLTAELKYLNKGNTNGAIQLSFPTDLIQRAYIISFYTGQSITGISSVKKLNLDEEDESLSYHYEAKEHLLNIVLSALNETGFTTKTSLVINYQSTNDKNVSFEPYYNEQKCVFINSDFELETFGINTTDSEVFSQINLKVINTQSGMDYIINSDKSGKGTITIYDIQGKSVYSTIINFNAGVNYISEPVDLVRGTYLVQLKTGDNAVSTKLIR